MDANTVTPRNELTADDIVVLLEGKFVGDEWKVAGISGDWLRIERLYPRPGVMNAIDTKSPVRRIS